MENRIFSRWEYDTSLSLFLYRSVGKYLSLISIAWREMRFHERTSSPTMPHVFDIFRALLWLLLSIENCVILTYHPISSLSLLSLSLPLSLVSRSQHKYSRFSIERTSDYVKRHDFAFYFHLTIALARTLCIRASAPVINVKVPQPGVGMYPAVTSLFMIHAIFMPRKICVGNTRFFLFFFFKRSLPKLMPKTPADHRLQDIFFQEA